MSIQTVGALALPEPEMSAATHTLRHEVRDFLRQCQRVRRFTPSCDAWHVGFDPEFSRSLGARGWLGISWPTEYGGGARSNLDRFVITEELLAAGAPVAAHWVADRQSGPSLLRHGSEQLRQEFLPRMAAGELYFALGFSEPDSGSDLASVRTRATSADDGWLLSGTKVWSSHAHRCDYIMVLARTSGQHGDRHRGLSQLIVDLRDPGVQVRPIRMLGGSEHFNEVVFDEVFVPDERLLGAEGNGWVQLRGELALERSGPERYMSNFLLMSAFAEEVQHGGLPGQEQALGELLADFITLRRLSAGVAGDVERGNSPVLSSALVKDLGTQFEQKVCEVVRRSVPIGRRHPETRLGEALRTAQLMSPGAKFRGGTNEILRTIVAKELGL